MDTTIKLGGVKNQFTHSCLFSKVEHSNYSHYLQLTTHYLQLTTYNLQLTTYNLLLTTYNLQLTTYNLLLTTHYFGVVLYSQMATTANNTFGIQRAMAGVSQPPCTNISLKR